MTRYRILMTIGLTALLTSIAACIGAPAPVGPTSATPENAAVAGEKLKAVATTTIVGDVVRQVAGDAVDLSVLLPPGADPHGFQPKPQDAALIANADLVFVNGLQLEEFLDRLIASAGGAVRVVSVSDGIEAMADQDREHEAEVHADEHSGKADVTPTPTEEHDHSGVDPHVWMDPNNVHIWTRNIVAALSEMDPANAAIYQANAERYDQTLQALDAWVKEQVAQVAPENRRMVVDHDAFSHFAQRYGFEIVGAVVPGYSSMSAPSAQQLARLEDAIRSLGVKAVFVGSTVNPALAKRVAADTGTQLVFLFTGSLSEPGGAAATYEDFVRYNVNAIVEALK